MDAPQKRLFFAIVLPGKALEACDEFQKANRVLPVRWIPLKNLHVTTLFLGSVPEEKLLELKKAAAKALVSARTAPIRFTSFDWGPPGTTPRMIWLNANADAEWNAIKDTLRNAAKELRIYRETDERPFTPHVTIARMEPMPRKNLPEIATPFLLTFEPNEVLLMESKLSPKGATYVTLKKFSIQKKTSPD